MISRVTEALSKVKGSMGSHERHALPGVIGDDLLRFGKLPLCLFICIGKPEPQHRTPPAAPPSHRPLGALPVNQVREGAGPSKSR